MDYMARPHDFLFPGGDHPERSDEEPARITDEDAVPEWGYATDYLEEGDKPNHLKTIQDQIRDQVSGRGTPTAWSFERDDDGIDGKQGESSVSDAPGYILSLPDQLPEVTAEEAEAKFKEEIGGVRLVYDFRSGKLAGIATWDPDEWSWQTTELETKAQSQFRQAGINLLTDLVAQVTGHIPARPSDLDQAVSAASQAADPRSVALKLCNAAGQALAHHFGLGIFAPAIGALVEQTLSPLVGPPGRLSKAVKDLQVLDVTVDIATDQLTPAVNDFAVSELGGVLQDKTRGISQAELDKIAAAIKQREAAAAPRPALRVNSAFDWQRDVTYGSPVQGSGQRPRGPGRRL